MSPRLPPRVLQKRRYLPSGESDGQRSLPDEPRTSLRSTAGRQDPSGFRKDRKRHDSPFSLFRSDSKIRKLSSAAIKGK